MYQTPQMPPHGTPYYSASMPPKRGMPTWAIIVIATTVSACVFSGMGVAALSLLHSGTPLSSPKLPASVGESLTITNVTVTLTSAEVVTTGYVVGTGQAVPGVALTLHCWNQTKAEQSLSTSHWRLYIDGGTLYYSLDTDGGPLLGVLLAPYESQDMQFTVKMNVGDLGPYTLQTDFTTPQGQPLAWTFTG